MLDYDKKGLNMLPFVQIVLQDVFFLFFGGAVKKVRNSQVLMHRKAMGMIFKKEKMSHEVSKAKRAK